MTFRIDLFNVMYYDSVILKGISVCNLLHHNTVHPAEIITCPVRDVTFSALSASTWAHPPENSASTEHLMPFSTLGL